MNVLARASSSIWRAPFSKLTVYNAARPYPRSTPFSAACATHNALTRQLSTPRSQRSVRRPRYPEGYEQWNNVIGNEVIKPTVNIRTKEETWLVKSQEAKMLLASHPPANAYSGRSVRVFGGNVGDAYQRLEAILRRNKVKAELRRAERHEKKGAKRRRLNSERWRRQFAHEVRKKVQLVTKIRNRGA